MKTNRMVVATPTVVALEEYVQTRVCEHHHWEAVQTVVKRHLIRRSNGVCGLLIQIEGPRAHKSHAIWAGHENRVMFYDTTGQRFAEVQLSDAPDPSLLEKSAA